jgi:hypothetical protein
MDKMIVVSLDGYEHLAQEYFDEFLTRYTFVEEATFVFTPNESYGEYNEDIQTIKRGYSRYAEFIDPRSLPLIDTQPIRLLLTEEFFTLSSGEKDESILHELGHYFTNPGLVKIREYIAEKNPPLLSIRGGDKRTTDAAAIFNESLNFLFQLPKLVQEMNAEMWVYENATEVSQKRLLGYCRPLQNAVTDFQNARVEVDFFFQIPRITFLVMFRVVTIGQTSFDFAPECMNMVGDLKESLFRLSSEAGWDGLRILDYHDEFTDYVLLGSEGIESVIKLFEKIFDDYIVKSLGFFPIKLRKGIRNLYGI